MSVSIFVKDAPLNQNPGTLLCNNGAQIVSNSMLVQLVQSLWEHQGRNPSSQTTEKRKTS